MVSRLEVDRSDGLHDAGGPVGAIKLLELFEQNLQFLAIRSIGRDEMDTLGSSVSLRIHVDLYTLGSRTFAFFISSGVASS